jgi:DNA-binding NtrC family response regulator
MTVRAQTFDGPNLQSPRSQLPALHERRDQIIPLFSQFSNAADLDLGSGHQALGAALTQVLLSHSWPGNIRELKSAAKRFVLGFPLLGAGPGEAPESECRGERFGHSFTSHWEPIEPAMPHIGTVRRKMATPYVHFQHSVTRNRLSIVGW